MVKNTPSLLRNFRPHSGNLPASIRCDGITPEQRKLCPVKHIWSLTSSSSRAVAQGYFQGEIALYPAKLSRPPANRHFPSAGHSQKSALSLHQVFLGHPVDAPSPYLRQSTIRDRVFFASAENSRRLPNISNALRFRACTQRSPGIPRRVRVQDLQRSRQSISHALPRTADFSSATYTCGEL